MIGGIPIRMIIFGAVAVLLAAMIVHAILDSKITLMDSKSSRFIFRSFNKFDYLLALFIGLNLIWVFIIPYFSGYGIVMALKQTLSMSMLLLYFPIIMLIRQNYIKWQSNHRIIGPALLVLAGLHIFLYLGETYRQDATFAINFFESMMQWAEGYSVRPTVMYPMNYFKIIYPNSIFLVAVLYYSISNPISIKTVTFHIIGLTALLTTLSKSLWFGAIGGMLLIGGYYLILNKNLSLRKKHYRKVAAYLLITVISTLVLDHFAFNNYVLARLNSSFQIQHGVQHVVSKNIDTSDRQARFADELAGTERSNLTRAIQTKELLNKWRQSPWFGFGFGSYADKYLRSSAESPYAYEMLLPSMLVQVGAVGALVWLLFLFYIIFFVGYLFKTHNQNAFPALYLLLALGIATQFNPFLFSSSGMSLVLFSLIDIRHKQIAIIK